MEKNTSLSLGSHFEDFINKEISSGKYSSASEVIRSALRLLEKQENISSALNMALEEGEESGFVDDFSPNEYLSGLNNGLKK